MPRLFRSCDRNFFFVVVPVCVFPLFCFSLPWGKGSRRRLPRMSHPHRERGAAFLGVTRSLAGGGRCARRFAAPSGRDKAGGNARGVHFSRQISHAFQARGCRFQAPKPRLSFPDVTDPMPLSRDGSLGAGAGIGTGIAIWSNWHWDCDWDRLGLGLHIVLEWRWCHAALLGWGWDRDRDWVCGWGRLGLGLRMVLESGSGIADGVGIGIGIAVGTEIMMGIGAGTVIEIGIGIGMGDWD